MKQMKSFVRILIVAVVVIGIMAFIVVNWSWVFAKKIHGKILDVQRVTNPTAIITSRVSEAQIHSYAVLLQGDDGALYTSSSEDRQWQVAQKGYCVTALLYRYPPWDLERANTFFNARLERLELCNGQAPPPAQETPHPETPPPAVLPPPLPSAEPGAH